MLDGRTEWDRPPYRKVKLSGKYIFYNGIVCLCEPHAEQRHQQGHEEELLAIGDKEQCREERYTVESLDEARYPQTVLKTTRVGLKS